MLGLFVAFVAGCGGGDYELEFAFEASVDPSSVRYIELLVLPSCPDASSVDVGDPPIEQAVARLGLARDERDALPALESLAPGRYGFYARGFDQTCHAVVSSCVPVRIDEDDGRVNVMLEPTSTATLGCGSGSICRDGRCDAMDASNVLDACDTNPCAADQFCTDLPAPAPDDETGRICTPHATCSTGQFQLTAPTARSDRVCANCAATCAGGSYQSVACADGNGTQDRLCLPISNCTTGQYQASPQTSTSDRVCGTCVTCSGTQYETQPCADGNGSQPRTCQLVTQCTTGQFQTIPPTATSDRTCGTCDVCTVSEYETTACANNNGTQDRVCTLLTNCTMGQFQSTLPTATTNRACTACHVCAADEYIALECSNGNGTQDRTCGGGTGVCTLVSSADGSNTGTNSDPTMSTTNTGAQQYLGFVRFDLTGTCAEGGTIPSGSTVTAVTISLTQTAACVCASPAHELRRITAAWTEASTLSGSNPSVNGSTSATFTTPGVGSTVTISGGTLVSNVQGFLDLPATNFGFRIGETNIGGNTASPYAWATREATNATTRPRIVITYTRP